MAGCGNRSNVSMCKKVLRIQEEASTDGMSDPLSAQLPSRIENTKGLCSYMTSAKLWGFLSPHPCPSKNKVLKFTRKFPLLKSFGLTPSVRKSYPYLAIQSPNGSPWPGCCHQQKKENTKTTPLSDKPVQVSPRLSIN